jgi:hypothetical protein
LVVLRDFGAQKKEKNYSILQFIEMRSAAWYQVQAPQKAFEYLLLNGRAIIIFDGLDELLETSYRREIADDIETFCNLYPSTPTIVTSRVVGYEQAPLNRRKFEPYQLLDFDEDQVREYATKWFSTDDAMTMDQRTKRAEAFISESRSVPDLRANPLMLSLMCNIYLGEDFIPTNRPELYKKCALMLFDRWDRSRRISTGYAFENQLSPIMTHIAHWLYSQPALQSGVTEQQLVQECAKYLYPKRYEHPEEAEKAAADVIEFCRGRAWVFSDTGTTPTGMSLYQFTHRTFLEYFTALFLFRNNPKPSELLAVLRPRVAKREWDVVAQLAFHIASREVEGGGDELMLGLLSANPSFSERLNLLTFASRCMEFISCSPKTSREVTEATLEAYLTWASKLIQSGKLLEHGMPRPEAADLIRNLLHTGVENRSTVAECIERFLCEKLGNNSGPANMIAAEVAVRLSRLVNRRSDATQTGSDIAKQWGPLRQRVLESNQTQLLKIYSKQLPVALAAYFAGSTSLEDLVAWHGVKSIFKQVSSLTECDAWTPIGQSYLYQALASDRSAKLWEILQPKLPELENIGRILLKHPLPWTSRPSFASSLIPWVFDVSYPGPPLQNAPVISPDALFGVFVLAASVIEAIEGTKEEAIFVDRPEHSMHLGLLSPLRRSLFARISKHDASQVEAELSSSFRPDQAAFVLRWTTRKINFVRHHGRRMRLNPQAQESDSSLFAESTTVKKI